MLFDVYVIYLIVSKIFIIKFDTKVGKNKMSKIYGYVRVSTINQRTQRQIDNIKLYNSEALIREEKQSGKDIENRAVFRKLLSDVQSGDTIIFDEVSRMSRNADEGFNLYMELLEKGINLVFIKEPHINTDEYERRTKSHISKFKSQDPKIDKFVNGMLDLISEFEKDNLKDNIRLAFEQAEHERLFLIKRVKEGKDRSEKTQGRPVGSLNQKTAKEEYVKKIIREQSKDFEGNFSDAKIMREYLNIARNTYYKYKNELKVEKIKS